MCPAEECWKALFTHTTQPYGAQVALDALCSRHRRECRPVTMTCHTVGAVRALLDPWRFVGIGLAVRTLAPDHGGLYTLPIPGGAVGPRVLAPWKAGGDRQCPQEQSRHWAGLDLVPTCQALRRVPSLPHIR